MNAPIESKNVSQTLSYSWSVKISEYGGKIVAEWSSSAPFEPDHAHLFLFLGEKRVAIHKTGAASGKHTFDQSFGSGFRLALGGRDFEGNDVELVSTSDTTESHDPLEKSVSYSFSISLNMVDNQAQLQWDSDAPFRPRQSRALVFENGDIVRDPWIEKPNGNIPTDLRWGVGLAAAFAAEDFSGKRIDVARTPTTRRS